MACIYLNAQNAWCCQQQDSNIDCLSFQLIFSKKRKRKRKKKFFNLKFKSNTTQVFKTKISKKWIFKKIIKEIYIQILSGKKKKKKKKKRQVGIWVSFKKSECKEFTNKNIHTQCVCVYTVVCRWQLQDENDSW